MIALEGSRQVVVEGSRPGKPPSPWLFPFDQKAKSISVGVLDIRCPKYSGTKIKNAITPALSGLSGFSPGLSSF